MGMLSYLVLFLVVVALTIVAGIYTIKAALAITQNANYNTDTNLQAAHKYLTIASTVCWVSIALIITLIVLYIVFGIETVMYTGEWVAMGLLVIILALCTTIGILSALALSYMRRSANFTNQGSDHSAYTDTIVAICFGLGSAAVLVLGLITYGVYLYQRSRREAAAHQALIDTQALALEDALQQRKVHLLEQRQRELELRRELNQPAQGIPAREISTAANGSAL